MSDDPLTRTLRENAKSGPYVPSALALDALAEWAHERHAWRTAVEAMERRCTALRAMIADRDTQSCRYCGFVAARVSDNDCPKRFTVRGQWRALLVRLLART